MRRSPATRKPAAATRAGTAEQWRDAAMLDRLLDAMEAVRARAIALEHESERPLRHVHTAYARSARNLLHDVAPRRHDLRVLQEQLALLGLSSLGRTESHVLAAGDSVLRILRAVRNRATTAGADDPHAVRFSGRHRVPAQDRWSDRGRRTCAAPRAHHGRGAGG